MRKTSDTLKKLTGLVRKAGSDPFQVWLMLRSLGASSDTKSWDWLHTWCRRVFRCAAPSTGANPAWPDQLYQALRAANWYWTPTDVRAWYHTTPVSASGLLSVLAKTRTASPESWAAALQYSLRTNDVIAFDAVYGSAPLSLLATLDLRLTAAIVGEFTKAAELDSYRNRTDRLIALTALAPETLCRVLLDKTHHPERWEVWLTLGEFTHTAVVRNWWLNIAENASHRDGQAPPRFSLVSPDDLPVWLATFGKDAAAVRAAGETLGLVSNEWLAFLRTAWSRTPIDPTPQAVTELGTFLSAPVSVGSALVL